LQVFTADEPEVDLLPREGVAAFLEEHHWPSAMSYLEHVVTELGDTSSDMHDKLATLYLRCVREPPTASAAGRRRKEVAQGEGKDEHDEHKEREERAVAQLLEFLNTSTQYRAHRLLSVLGKDGEYITTCCG
jgi:hypothetical protein